MELEKLETLFNQKHKIEKGDYINYVKFEKNKEFLLTNLFECWTEKEVKENKIKYVEYRQQPQTSTLLVRQSKAF